MSTLLRNHLNPFSEPLPSYKNGTCIVSPKYIQNLFQFLLHYLLSRQKFLVVQNVDGLVDGQNSNAGSLSATDIQNSRGSRFLTPEFGLDFNLPRRMKLIAQILYLAQFNVQGLRPSFLKVHVSKTNFSRLMNPKHHSGSKPGFCFEFIELTFLAGCFFSR